MKTSIPNQLRHSLQGADPEVTRWVQMEPMTAETFGLKRVPVHRGKSEETTVHQVLPTGAEKGRRIVQMLNDLPAGDRGSFFRFQGGKKFLIQNSAKAPLRLSPWNGFRFESGHP
jgi:hypothetical protein